MSLLGSLPTSWAKFEFQGFQLKRNQALQYIPRSPLVDELGVRGHESWGVMREVNR